MLATGGGGRRVGGQLLSIVYRDEGRKEMFYLTMVIWRQTYGKGPLR